MEKYDYRQVLKDDIKDWIASHNVEVTADDKESVHQELYDQLWAEDEVTGNGGNFYFSRQEAEEAICHNLDLLGEALEEFCVTDLKKYMTDARSADATIRCYLLGECIESVLEDIIEQEEENLT